ncbi:type I secretion protein [Salipiger bermudensis]|uniref:calcium-binding protein n=1 Tax=Salipiger bermudensis TaxID=344736 RepID=UPI001C995589|nr:type I secretion protein [Salipiger bermudensis]MBY6005033.1 type I secretion protein [Salipiger bermudensis]
MTPFVLFMLLFGGLLASAGGSGNGEAFEPEDDGEGELMRGGEESDTLEGGDGDDTVSGGGGNDALGGGAGDDLIDGGPGNDLIIDALGSDSATGGMGVDVMIFSDTDLGAPDLVEGGDGNDVLWGDDGDTLTGGANADIFIVPIGQEGAAPVTITDLDFTRFTDQQVADRVVFVTPEGELIPRAAFFDGSYAVGIGDLQDGSGAYIVNGSDTVAIIEGYTADELFYETIWIGNFSPALTGFYDGDDALTGTEGRDELFAGLGTDTITGLGGGDYLDGQAGDDVVIGVDGAGAEAVGDSLVGNGGDDTLRGDAGDLLAGGPGNDSYELVVPAGEAAGAPMRLYTYDLAGSGGAPERITLTDAAGTPLSAREAAAGLSVRLANDGSGAALVFGGAELAVIDGVAPENLDAPELWLGNLASDMPLPPAAPPVPFSAATGITVLSATGTGEIIDEAYFGGNMVFSVNTVDGVPKPTFGPAAEALDISHLRFPAGQGDAGDLEVDGEGFLNILVMEQGPDGDWELRDELVAALDWARENDAQLTLVLPTKNYTVAEYEALDREIARFAEAVMRDHADVVEAFEIGNEYWSMGETAYGSKADVAAVALARGMEAAGFEADDQPAILVQMASPFAGSEFHVSVDDRPFAQRVDLANQTIIDQLGDAARDAIDGVVEHYYFDKQVLAFEGTTGEVNFINRDFSTWDDAFDKELDLYITEWNVRTSTTSETGLRSASVMLEMTANMSDLGVDAAHVWPVQHNTPTDLAGKQQEDVITDAEGRVINTINGAAFDLMSSSLVGLEALETELSSDDGSFTFHAWQGEDSTVVYVASRATDTLELALDLSELVPEYVQASAVRISADFSANSSDGVHFVPGAGFQEAESLLIDGQRYYINENDVRAELTDFEIDGTTVPVTLRPFEVIEITFDTTGVEAPPSELVPEGRVLTGSAGPDILDGGDGDDTIQGLAGDDTLTGGKGDDRGLGGAGNDRLRGWGGDDYLKGGDGDDQISGNQGDDTLVGSLGNDTLNGAEDDDELNGMVGDDRLAGGAGADTVTGWAGRDIFALAAGDLTPGDVVTDFTPGEDVIEVDLPGIRSLSDVTFVAGNDGITLRFGSEGSLLLQGDLRLAEVNVARNFVFL